MSDSPDITLRPVEMDARRVMRESVLADLDARFSSAGGLEDYLYTAPRADVERMLRRATIVCEDARALPGEDAAALAASERVLLATRLLETEVHCRDLVAQEPLDERGQLAYDLPENVHAVSQRQLAARLAYHAAKFDNNHAPGAGFDQAQARSDYLRHLVAQQLDAYDRGLEVVPAEETKFELGRQVHEHLTREMMSAQRQDDPARLIQEVGQVGGRIADHEQPVRDAVEHFRDYRDYVINMTGQDVYPRDLPEHLQSEWRGAARAVDGETRRPLVRAPERQQSRDAAVAPEVRFARHGSAPATTAARDAYLDARDQAAAVGAVLADPTMRSALELAKLEHGYKTVARSLRDDYEGARKPPAWRSRARAEWQREQPVVQALLANSAEQERLRSQLGPDSDKLVARAVGLSDVREQILARTIDLQRDAVDEELASEPEWLTETLGPHPETDAGRWRSLAGEMAANRLRFAVTDDADPGVRPEQSLLADKVAFFRAQAGLERGASLTAAVGLGM